ncbi:MAG: tRNA (guanosine(46)-N7)-methyltransferase TrmB [Rhodospirillaceae bacterium]|nr:tRNA (guanosine(46)-N7)-methyltransferase TrmB [Rhodospirillaceae bacterium]|tara:strand:- start:118 stop:810 length:693 start_codon:yes stop_codon:yes gene_type:complete
MAERTEIRFYGRRHGRQLRPARRRLISEILPLLEISPDRTAENHQFDSAPEHLWMEIGFGAGEHLATLVKDYPGVGFIGCEPFINGVASLLAKIEAGDEAGPPKNLKIFPDDARLLMPHLPANAFERIYALFPDPWPKTRHHRRRLMSPSNLDQFARLLRPGGLLRFASDHMEYVRWTLWHVGRHPKFEWLAEGPEDWRQRDRDSIPTRYESKALARGEVCVYLTFRRCD